MTKHVSAQSQTLADVIADGRQSPAALDIARGVNRLLHAFDMAALSELSLANGRRADIVGLSKAGEIWIVEIKSSVEDFRSDNKWPDYRDYCDRFFFAVAPSFPAEILPEHTGLILADKFGATISREAEVHKLAASRRKAVSLRFSRTAAYRLMFAFDPDLGRMTPGAEK